LAVALRSALIVNEQALVPEQAPDHPLKVEREEALAVSLSEIPCL